MALFRKLLPKKPPDGLVWVFERIYVFGCCFTEISDIEDYNTFVGNIISRFKLTHPKSSIMIINFGEEEKESRIASALSEYGITIIDYPRHYEGCPLLSVEVIHHFLNSSESWLSVSPQNFLIMHSELGGWPVLAFMVAALSVYRKKFTMETKALEMVHKQAPLALLHEASPMNPVPSQLRYLQYILRRNADTEWPPAEKALTLDCVTMRMIPDFDGKGGCCPIFRIYGRNPLLHIDKSPKLLFSTPRRSKNIRYYNQEDSDLVEIDINCHMQDDIVLECISLHDDMVCEKIMYRAMFNTVFIKSNMLILNCDEIDMYWDAKDNFPRNFRVELYFSEMDGKASMTIPVDLSCFDQEGLPVEAFANVQEMFNIHDNDDGSNRLHQRALRKIINKMKESSLHHRIRPRNLLQTLPKRNNQDKESEGLTQERATTSIDEKILCNIEYHGEGVRLIPVRLTPDIETSEEQPLDSEIRSREISDEDLTDHAPRGSSIPEAGPSTSSAATSSNTLIMAELHWIREFMIEERQHRNWLQQAVLGLAEHMHYQGLPQLPQPFPAPENTPADPKDVVLQTDTTESDTEVAPAKIDLTPPATSVEPSDETASPKPRHP
uniref:formin-like protein 18 isoform X2 n=1 Tax=Erigeron canadensis TaxID=72917 RepID=UPI001CB8A5CF|nr:formin-like protein 18 isoform X2 [Erigeron canadensis]XP_043620413.1 formin-like protein 18 isoform X2 [Erigeron canadensis]XP_043620414.1 formin-like protein 18 isoform X2 [Erigeron canadensis]XP_043620415.1 formin-like protein 18 isoform X2 [Erigeron canadensis]